MKPGSRIVHLATKRLRGLRIREEHVGTLPERSSAAETAPSSCNKPPRPQLRLQAVDALIIREMVSVGVEAKGEFRFRSGASLTWWGPSAFPKRCQCRLVLMRLQVARQAIAMGFPVPVVLVPYLMAQLLPPFREMLYALLLLLVGVRGFAHIFQVTPVGMHMPVAPFVRVPSFFRRVARMRVLFFFVVVCGIFLLSLDRRE